MHTILQDLRYAVRGLRRTPGFTLAAVLTLGLGIGATTTIFTVVNGVLLRPLPYAHADRIANIWNDFGEGAQSLPAVSPLDFRDYQRRSRTFESFAAATAGSVVGLRGNLTGEGEPERVDLATVTANFFPLFGIAPQHGRDFDAAEEAPNGPHVVMLSDRLWRRRYGADPRVVGSTIQLDGVAHTVVGVLPAGFRLALPTEAFLVTDAEMWAPLQFDYGNAPPRNYTFFTVFGRLKPEVTFAQAQAEMDGIALQFRKEFPEHTGTNVRIRAVPLQQDVVKHARPALLVLLGAVALVLAIACANVAHLLLVRATVREGEFALRTALGASRWAVVRQLLTESAVLALTGGALGLMVTTLGLGLLRALHPSNLPRLGEVDVDGRVLAFTAVVCLLTTLTFGLAPALQAARNDPQRALQAGGRSGTSAARHRIRSLLILGEVALSVVLLIGAGLLVRSFLALQQVRPGFDASDVLTLQIALPGGRYPTPNDRRTFIRELERRLGDLPGVTRAGVTSQLPLTGSGSLSPFAFDEATARNWESVTADGRSVSPGFFAAMNTRLLAGRGFTWDDAVGKPPVIVIDETLARQAWPGRSAVGRQLQLGPTGQANNMAEVIGVVEHQRSHDLTRAVRPLIYYSMGQQIPVVLDVAIESDVAPGSLARAATDLVHDMDKDLAVTRTAPMTFYLSEGRAQARFSFLLMAALGGIALLLAAVGIFGVIAYTVTQRTREFGIRIALGEDPARTRRSVVVRSMRLVLASIAVGLAASLVLARLLAGQLYGVSPADPLTFAGIAALLAVTALGASYLPARRATHVDPITALRAD
ncbi:MAG TPA: ABC transporter permease [Gemmatimonadales bacterium]|nr:ABC transporter permease [Gemmatimonadales bacterium]